MALGPRPPGNSSKSPTLTGWQISYFTDRGVAVAAAVASGARAVSAEEVEALLRFAPRQPREALAFFYPGTQPQFVRLRFEDGDYLSPQGAEIPIFCPFTSDAADERLLIVESPTKALAVMTAGYVVVGLGGVATCLTKDGELNESWSRVHLKDRSVVLLFDNDLDNPAVASALHRLARALKAAGAAVIVAILPRGATKMGPDDYLVAHGEDALKAVIDAAVPALPAERLTLLEQVSDARERHAQLAQLLEDPVFIVGLLNGGPAELAACREPFRKAGMANDLRAALRTGRQALAEAHGNGGGGLRRYDLVDGAFQSEDGTRLTNFDARLIRDVERDD